MVVLAGLIELAVAIGLTFGFMTRTAAFGGAIYLFVAVGLGGHYTAGYIWVLPTGGWEFPALWISVISTFIFSGGGKISIDAWLKQQRT
jgi:putative oxidoreductase